tara:strand:+ start:2459 stop:2665 length:207 start_codon:yes stop_codon:yes gene_type:complete
MIDTDEYENMTWETPSDELEDAVENLLTEVKRLQRRNEWLEEVVALAQEHESIDLSDYGWPQWEGEEE